MNLSPNVDLKHARPGLIYRINAWCDKHPKTSIGMGIIACFILLILQKYVQH